MTGTRRAALPLIALALACPVRAQAPPVRESYVPVLVDGSLAGSALVRDGVAYLPLRSVTRALRLGVSYDADAQLILIRTPPDGRRPDGPPGARPAPVQ